MKGWVTKKLGGLCRIRTGKKDVNQGNPEGQFPFFTCAAEHTYSDSFSFDTEALLIAGNGDVGKVSYYNGKFEAYQRTYVLSDFTEVLPRFLFQILDGKLKETVSKQKLGNTMPYIKVGMLTDFELPVPPLAEQQRIVGVLDEAFEGLATARANAEKNLQNARALFESHLQAVFTQRGPGWVETTLGNEIDLLAGFAFKSTQYTDADGAIRLVRGDNIVQGSLRWDDVKKWPANDTAEYERYQLREGDVVLAMDRPWVKAGLKRATISAQDLPCLLVQRTARLRGGANLDNRFLVYLIGSTAFTAHILGVQTGIGVPHISGQQIKDFEFIRPPKAEQRKMADQLDALSAETQRLTSLYERKQAALEALKKSLLHQAFAGEL
jgi:type I restriction enzyme S subunit